MNISIIIAIMMLIMVTGVIVNINAIAPNMIIPAENNSSIDKSKFDWGPINGPEREAVPSPEEDTSDEAL
jgi:hypothetical protein